MLRLALVENLRRLAVAMVKAREEREAGRQAGGQTAGTFPTSTVGLVPQISERMGKRDKLPQSFVVQLIQRLREQDPASRR